MVFYGKWCIRTKHETKYSVYADNASLSLAEDKDENGQYLCYINNNKIGSHETSVSSAFRILSILLLPENNSIIWQSTVLHNTNKNNNNNILFDGLNNINIKNIITISNMFEFNNKISYEMFSNAFSLAQKVFNIEKTYEIALFDYNVQQYVAKKLENKLARERRKLQAEQNNVFINNSIDNNIQDMVLTPIDTNTNIKTKTSTNINMNNNYIDHNNLKLLNDNNDHTIEIKKEENIKYNENNIKPVRVSLRKRKVIHRDEYEEGEWSDNDRTIDFNHSLISNNIINNINNHKDIKKNNTYIDNTTFITFSTFKIGKTGICNKSLFLSNFEKNNSYICCQCNKEENDADDSNDKLFFSCQNTSYLNHIVCFSCVTHIFKKNIFDYIDGNKKWLCPLCTNGNHVVEKIDRRLKKYRMLNSIKKEIINNIDLPPVNTLMDLIDYYSNYVKFITERENRKFSVSNIMKNGTIVPKKRGRKPKNKPKETNVCLTSNDSIIIKNNIVNDSEDVCFVCKDGGNLITCDFKHCYHYQDNNNQSNKGRKKNASLLTHDKRTGKFIELVCPKVYHEMCLGFKVLLVDNRKNKKCGPKIKEDKKDDNNNKNNNVNDLYWQCPRHLCLECGSKDISYSCRFCPTSYCQKHFAKERKKLILLESSSNITSDNNDEILFLSLNLENLHYIICNICEEAREKAITRGLLTKKEGFLNNNIKMNMDHDKSVVQSKDSIDQDTNKNNSISNERIEQKNNKLADEKNDHNDSCINNRRSSRLNKFTVIGNTTQNSNGKLKKLRPSRTSKTSR